MYVYIYYMCISNLKHKLIGEFLLCGSTFLPNLINDQKGHHPIQSMRTNVLKFMSSDLTKSPYEISLQVTWFFSIQELGADHESKAQKGMWSLHLPGTFQEKIALSQIMRRIPNLSRPLHYESHVLVRTSRKSSVRATPYNYSSPGVAENSPVLYRRGLLNRSGYHQSTPTSPSQNNEREASACTKGTRTGSTSQKKCKRMHSNAGLRT